MTHPTKTLIRNIRSSLTLPLAAMLASLAVLSPGCAPSPAAEPPGPPPPPIGWDEGVRLPAAVDRNPAPEVVEIDLEARVAMVEVIPGLPSELWTYDGGLPGPLIRVPVGARLVVHFTNHLPEETTVHWHGVRVPADMDGVPEHNQPAVPPGGSFDYVFTVPDTGLFWYHPHVRSAKQVGDGLYGALLVQERPLPRGRVATAPTDGGARTEREPSDLGGELVLVLSDMSLDSDGKLAPSDGGGDLGTLFGREGNIVLVNGKVKPTVLAHRGLRQRWRLVNSAKSRYFQLAITGHRFTRIGGDGGLVPFARDTDMLVLTPGERADVLVTFDGDPGARLPVRWVPYDRGYGSTEFRAQVDVLYVQLTTDEPATSEFQPALPERLRTIAPLDVSTAGTVAIELTQSAVNKKLVLGIGGVPSWDAQPLHARVGDTQVWTIINSMDWDHPFHLHGFFFQALEAGTGAPPPSPEWKDTINVPRRQTVPFAVHFDGRPGMWMFHCHILDHADAGMMGMVHLQP